MIKHTHTHTNSSTQKLHRRNFELRHTHTRSINNKNCRQVLSSSMYSDTVVTSDNIKYKTENGKDFGLSVLKIQKKEYKLFPF